VDGAETNRWEQCILKYLYDKCMVIKIKYSKKCNNDEIILCIRHKINRAANDRCSSAEAAVTVFIPVRRAFFTWQSSLDLLSQCRADDGARCARTHPSQSIAGLGRTTISVCNPFCRRYSEHSSKGRGRQYKIIIRIVYYDVVSARFMGKRESTNGFKK